MKLKQLSDVSKETVISWNTKTLLSVVRSTAPEGKYWLQRVWAMDELTRRGEIV